MSDFETRLSEALSIGAEEAPAVDRLADGARTRAKARRRTRAALVAVGVVAVLAAPVTILALSSGDDTGAEPDRSDFATDGEGDHSYDGTTTPAVWHTVEHDGALVDLPGGWGELDTSSCEFQWVRYGPPGTDPCDGDAEGLSFYASATFDPARGPGLDIDLENGSSGYVYAGDWAVWVTSRGPQEAMRILGSARTEGQVAPDLSAGFRTVYDDGLAIDVPADWTEGGLSAWCLDEDVPGWVQKHDTTVALIDCGRLGYGVAFGVGDRDDFIRERHGAAYPEDSWAGVAIAPDENGKPDGVVQVVAPTQGLAELIGGSLRVQ